MTVVLGNDQRLYGKLSAMARNHRAAERSRCAEQEPAGKITDILPGVVTGREWKRSGHVNIGWSDSSGNTDVSRLHAMRR
jgi:hypothetical protein